MDSEEKSHRLIDFDPDVVRAIRRAGKRRLRNGNFGRGMAMLQLIGQGSSDSSTFVEPRGGQTMRIGSALGVPTGTRHGLV